MATVRRASWDYPAMTRTDPNEDPRRRRTRQDLLAAFFSLVLSRRYHEIRVADVLSRSGVGRSTFYEHFSNKDALLSASLEGPFQILANLVRPDADANRVQGILEHFWDNRALARSLFQGAALRIVRRTLVGHVEAALDRDQRSRLRIPLRLAAHSLADGMFSPIVAWLSGEAKCTAQELAVALQLATAASVRALQTGQPSIPLHGDTP
ncbi:TetR/AcrR family transcriptional regulator [Lysobacter sp. 5GHs7-4]|uniref:TetR/AcrR family transcriptional regulator n=1 Tax=Lysobacter sp. 5GHs7-4 TaxID=2904253 RepID=UPI001E50191C|nr:TetR/AcrR family transcriptional regulator [Lysobacter sp. 5GHs7-4]UHQ24984.1 TetR/AcrR family transcriptional regulator [Lysobacter sp. 5GHs7-4]